MKYNLLGDSGIKASQIGLGTMTWGEQNTEQEAHEQLDYAVDQGVNLIDTAELYPVPPRQQTQGLSERYLGSWLARRSGRDKLVIASKFSAAADWLPYLRDGKNRADKKNIQQALEESLRRLGTDHIDLYQIHWPERETNFFGQLNYFHKPDKIGVPIEETLEVLSTLVAAGKIRHIGISNETAWGMSTYLRLAALRGHPRIVSIQNPYNLLNRSFEINLAEFSLREQVGLLAYSPLGFGVLSGKYIHGQGVDRARLTLFNHFTRYTNPQAQHAVRRYVELAAEHGLDAAQMALAYVNSRPFVSSNLIGATTMVQLKANIASSDIVLDKALIKAIEAIHVCQPNPCP